MHFFYESISIQSWIAFILLFVVMLLLNEFSRRNLWTGIFMFAVLPFFLAFFVWPITSAGTNVDNWFQHAKIISVNLGAWIFLALRYSKRVQSWNWYKVLPMLILVINILEAVKREFEISHMTTTTIVDGMTYMGGTWNVVNAWAGILNILIICGWFGIYVSKDKAHTMVWPDMLWFWIIAYDLWNFTYAYNALGDRSFYVFPVLFSATLAAHFIRKGAWLQHRTHTLAFNQLIMFTWPALFVSSSIAVHSSWNPSAMWLLSIISFVFNLGVFIYQIKTIITKKKNPLKDELYTDHNDYIEIKEMEEQF